MWFYVYDTSASSGSTGDPLLNVNPTTNYVPISGAAFGWVGAIAQAVSYSGYNGWYWQDIPQNTNFSCMVSGYNTVYSNTNGNTQMSIGMQPAGGK